MIQICSAAPPLQLSHAYHGEAGASFLEVKQQGGEGTGTGKNTINRNRLKSPVAPDSLQAKMNLR